MKIINKYGVKNIKVRILKNNLSELEAFDHEKEVVKCLKSFEYKLVNMTEGGEGCSGIIYSEESKKKMSQSQKTRTRTPEEIVRWASNRRGVPLSEEHKAKLKKPKSEAHKLKLSQSNKKAREGKILASPCKGAVLSEETKAKIREKRAVQVITDATKRKMSESHKARWTEAARKAQSKKSKIRCAAMTLEDRRKMVANAAKMRHKPKEE